MTTASRLRRALRAVVVPVVVPVVSLLLLTQPAYAATPLTWEDPPPMSLLQALLIFGGIPLALFTIITLLVVSPSLIRGDRQQRGVASWTEPQWFGRPGDAAPIEGSARDTTLVEVGTGASGDEASRQPGGASARW